MLFGVRFSLRSLDQLVDSMLETRHEFGSLGKDSAYAIGGPSLDEDTRRDLQMRRFRKQAMLGARETAYYAGLFKRLNLNPAKLSYEDIARFPLIHVMPYVDDWRFWLTAAGVAGIDPERGPRFDSSIAAYRAAEEGLGLAIGRGLVLGGALESGRLVAPFDMRLASAHAYYLACAEGTENVRKIAAFRRWLLAEVAALDIEPGGRQSATG